MSESNENNHLTSLTELKNFCFWNEQELDFLMDQAFTHLYERSLINVGEQ